MNNLDLINLTEEEKREKASYIKGKIKEVIIVIKEELSKDSSLKIEELINVDLKDLPPFFQKFYIERPYDNISNKVKFTGFLENISKIITSCNYNYEYLFEEIDKINFDTYNSASKYQADFINNTKTEYNEIVKQINKLKKEIKEEYIKNGIIKTDTLPNGKVYIRLEYGDLEKIDNDTRLKEYNEKKEKLEKEVIYRDQEYWFGNGTWNNWFLDIYKFVEKDFLFLLASKKSDDYKSLFITYDNFIKNHPIFEELISSMKEISFNKETLLKIENNSDFVEIMILDLFKDIIGGDFIKTESVENFCNLYIYEEKDLKILEEYDQIFKSVDENFTKKDSYHYRKNYIRCIQYEIKNSNQKNILIKRDKVKKKIENFMKLTYRINGINSEYKEYKNNFILYKDAVSPRYGTYNDVILHNFSVKKLPKFNYFSFSYRCYTRTGGEGWGGVMKYQGVEIARNEEELKVKLELKHNCKLHNGKWNKQLEEEGYLRLWTGEVEEFVGNETDNLIIKICPKCGKFHRYKEWNEFCGWQCKEAQESEKRRDETKVETKEEKVNLIDSEGIIDNEESVEKENLINYNSEDIAFIYKISNKETGKSYVGKTNKMFTQRWGQHFSWGNINPVFKEDIESKGVSIFNFEILEEINKNKLDLGDEDNFEKYVLIREQYYIDKFNTYIDGYNKRNNFKKEKVKQKVKASENNLKLNFD